MLEFKEEKKNIFRKIVHMNKKTEDMMIKKKKK